MRRSIRYLLLYAIICGALPLIAQVRVASMSTSFDSPPLGLVTQQNNLDGTGFFGVRGGAFEITDMEGTQCSPPFSVTNGMNDNRAFFILGPATSRFCDASISVSVELSSATFETCALPGQVNSFGCTDFIVSGPGGDGFTIEIRNAGGLLLKGGYCGSSAEGSFTASGFDIEVGDVMQVFIVGGTQAPDESYLITDINVEAQPRSFLGARIAQEDLTLCAQIDPLILNEITQGAQHQWYKDDVRLPGVTSGQLVIAPVALTDAGTYRVEVTEPGGCVSEDEIKVTVEECIGVPDFEFFTEYCQSDTIILSDTAPNGVMGTWQQTSPVVLRDSFGVVALTFEPQLGEAVVYTFVVAPVYETLYIDTLCETDIREINGTIYDILRPMGTETFSSQRGCDSVVNVRLHFIESIKITEDVTLCPGETSEVAGIPIDDMISNVLVYTGPNECDTLYDITVTVLQNDTMAQTIQLCTGMDTMISGVLLDADGQSDTITYPRVESCADSVVIYTLQIVDEVRAQYIDTLYTACDGSELLLNGETFTPERSTGEQTFVREGQCDSILVVSITFVDVDVYEQMIDLCPGDEYAFDNQVIVYGFSGMREQLSVGCDTLYQYFFTSVPLDTGVLIVPLCMGRDTMIHGVAFDTESRKEEIIVLPSSGACDSIIHVMIDPQMTVMTDYRDTLCHDDEIIIGTQTFDRNNPTGELILTATGGCDSIVSVDLFFRNEIVTEIIDTLCQGSAITVGQTIYDEFNPSGAEVLRSSDGCDSVVIVDLTFLDAIERDVNLTICSGGSQTIGGDVYDAARPNGVSVLAGIDGCDTFLNVSLSFLPPVEYNLTDTLCMDASIMVGTTIYDMTNPSGSELLSTSDGCDSLVIVDLAFADRQTVRIDTLICEGGMITIRGREYGSTAVDTIMSSGDGCDSTIIISVEVATRPKVTYDIEEITCDVPTGMIIVTTNARVLGWTGPNGFSADTRDIEITMAGNYVVDYQSNGCLYQDVVEVSADLSLPDIELAQQSLILCTDDTLYTGAATDAMVLGWTYGGAQVSTDQDVEITKSGTYTFAAMGDNGCVDSVSLSVTDGASVQISSAAIQSDRYRLSIEHPYGIRSINWTVSDGIYCTDCETIEVVVPDTIYVTLEITDEHGCRSADRVVLVPPSIVDPLPQAELYFPNAFAPDSEVNSRFYASSATAGLRYDLDIYDRWGGRLYRLTDALTNDQNQAWDGTHDGSAVAPGIYSYRARYTQVNGDVDVIVGSVLLIR